MDYKSKGKVFLGIQLKKGVSVFNFLSISYGYMTVIIGIIYMNM